MSSRRRRLPTTRAGVDGVPAEPGGAGFASAPVRNRAERGKQVVWLQTGRLTRGPRNTRILISVPPGTRGVWWVPAEEFVRRGKRERSRFARLYLYWGTSSCGPAAGSPNPSLATPQLAVRRALLKARSALIPKSQGYSGSGDPENGS